MTRPENDAILEAALEQELRGERPPDLTAGILEPGPRAAAAERSGGRWLSAALVLLAMGLVVAVWSVADADPDRGAGADDPRDPIPWHQDLLVPESVDEARRLLGESDELEARVFAVRDPGSDRLIAVQSHPLENLLAPLFGRGWTEPRVRADREQTVAWTADLDFVLGSGARAGAPFATHPLELLYHVPERGTLVVGIDDTAAPCSVQVRGLPIAWTLPRDHRLPAMLREATNLALAQAIEERGIALGRGGLDRLPAESTRVRAWSLVEADLGEFGRFPSLTGIDLTGSPQAVTPAGVDRLSGHPTIRSVILPVAGIGPAHLEAVVALPALRELFVGSQWDLMFRPMPIPENTIGDECATILAGATELTELFLPVTALTDVGVERLARLADLRDLTIGSPSIDGSGLAAFEENASLRNLTLFGCRGLTDDGMRGFGATLTAATRERDIGLVECTISPIGLASILAGGMVDELTLARCRPTASWPEVLRAIAGSGGPRKLTLTVDGDLRLEHLVHLAGCERLEDLEVAVTREQAIQEAVVDQLRAALPGVPVDVWHGPR